MKIPERARLVLNQILRWLPFLALLVMVFVAEQNCSKSPNLSDYTNVASTSANTGAGTGTTKSAPAATVSLATPSAISAMVGSSFSITYNWSATAPLMSNLTAFVHIEDSSGNIAFQADHNPATPTSQWSGAIADAQTVTVPATLTPGTYTVWTGLYAASTGVRMSLTAGANVVADNQLRYKVATLTVTAIPVNLTASTCQLTFSHCDLSCVGTAGVKNSVNEKLSSSGGLVRLSMGQNASDTNSTVNSDDIFFLKGNSCSTSTTDVDSYISSCSVSMGDADVNGTLPTLKFTMNSFNGVEASNYLFAYGDNVNSDDRMFIRMNCPAAANSTQSTMETYVKNNCYLCLGLADLYGTTPTKMRCAPVGNSTDSMADPTKWTGVNFPAGDTVNFDDQMFLGFYCSNYPTAGSPFVWVSNGTAATPTGASYPYCGVTPCSAPKSTGICELVTSNGFTVSTAYYNSTCKPNPVP